MSTRLSGKAALITGASRGIGRAVASAFLKEGARVFLCARGGKGLQDAATALQELGPEIGFAAADVGNPEEAQRLVESALACFPDLSILVNNASILGKRGLLVDLDVPTWDEVLRINTSSLFYVTRPLLPALIRRGSGSVINVSSSVGRKGKPNWGPYAVSKFGLEGFTQVLAEELRPQCRSRQQREPRRDTYRDARRPPIPTKTP